MIKVGSRLVETYPKPARYNAILSWSQMKCKMSYYEMFVLFVKGNLKFGITAEHAIFFFFDWVKLNI